MKTLSSFLVGSAAALLAPGALAQCPIANVTPAGVAAANVQQAYNQEFGVSAAGSYTFSGENLPAGLSLSNTGVLSGTPTTAGPAYARILATEAGGCVVSRGVSLPVGTAACASLANPGDVLLLDNVQASDFCVASAAIASEYTLTTVNLEEATNYALSTTGINVGAVTGPPAPRPEGGGLALAPLAENPQDAHGGHVPDTGGLPALDTAAQRAAALIAPQPQPHGTTPLVVDQIIDIQVAQGCSGARDMRKGRVEAISPGATPAEPLLFMVQEVIDDPLNPGTWIPSVPGGFIRSDFQVLIDAYEGLAPDPTTGSGQGTLGTLARTSARDTLKTNYGQMTDLDNNGGTIVFFTRAVNELSPPASSSLALGMFEGRDLFSSDPVTGCERSNAGEYIYLMVPDPTGVVNSNVRTVSFVWGNAVRTMAHFSTHLTTASRRLYVNGGTGLPDFWLDEGLAWISEEFLFFNTSFGLAPRQNIDLAMLTTGPNASRRVAAFNSYANPRFGFNRSHYLQNPTVSGMGGNRMGPLRRTPFATTGVNAHEVGNPQYSVTGTFLRYAADRVNGTDSVFWNALANSAASGYATLQSAIGGASPDDWARDFAVAFYADDNAFSVAAPYVQTSWNYRSVYGGLGGFPLGTNPLTDGATANTALGAGGGPRWLRFGLAAGQVQPALLNQRIGGNPLPANAKAVLLRTK